MLNDFRFEGEITEEPEPLYKGDDPKKGLNGHSVTLGQMGRGIKFYLPGKDLPEPQKGERVVVVGRLEANPTGWGKPKVERAFYADEVEIETPAVLEKA